MPNNVNRIRRAEAVEDECVCVWERERMDRECVNENVKEVEKEQRYSHR